MTKIKCCGLSREEDIAAVNDLGVDYAGFVFVPESKRYVTPQRARTLKEKLADHVVAVGVFVDEDAQRVAGLIDEGIIDMAQLHGHEDNAYIRKLRSLTDAPIIQAFVMASNQDVARAQASDADYVLLDAGRGHGQTFDWRLIEKIDRPYFLAGGLTPENVGEAVDTRNPFAVDVSSGIETEGLKDKTKIAAFVAAVRKDERK